jgi:uncharacterized membrane protein
MWTRTTPLRVVTLPVLQPTASPNSRAAASVRASRDVSRASVTDVAVNGTLTATTIAAPIWISNVVTFAVWYWEIDGGGPAQRRMDAHTSEDFLFPQMAQQDGKQATGWSAGFLDYLFLAFNTSTAFSPTDTAVLSQRAKVLTMVQSLLSLVIVLVLVGWAINTL